MKINKIKLPILVIVLFSAIFSFSSKAIASPGDPSGSLITAETSSYIHSTEQITVEVPCEYNPITGTTSYNPVLYLNNLQSYSPTYPLCSSTSSVVSFSITPSSFDLTEWPSGSLELTYSYKDTIGESLKSPAKTLNVIPFNNILINNSVLNQGSIVSNAPIKVKTEIKNFGRDSFNPNTKYIINLSGGVTGSNKILSVTGGTLDCESSPQPISKSGAFSCVLKDSSLAVGSSIIIEYEYMMLGVCNKDNIVGQPYSQVSQSRFVRESQYNANNSIDESKEVSLSIRPDSITDESFDYIYQGCSETQVSESSKVSSSGGGNGSGGIGVPKTGYSPLVTSLMIISAGAVLAGGSVIAFNKFKK